MTWHDMFVAGGSMGYLPQTILNLTYYEFECAYEGYSNHMIELRANALIGGYYAAYYSNAKHPRPLKKLLKEMYPKKRKQVDDTPINIDAIKCLEQTFREEQKNAR